MPAPLMVIVTGDAPLYSRGVVTVVLPLPIKVKPLRLASRISMNSKARDGSVETFQSHTSKAVAIVR